MHNKTNLLEKSVDILNKNKFLSFSEICNELWVSRATAYKFFNDKDDLLFQICNIVLDKIDDLLNWIMNDNWLDPFQKLEKIIIWKVELLNEYYFLYSFSQIINNKQILDRYYQQYFRIWKLLDQLKEKKLIKTELTTDWLLYTLDWLFYAWWYAICDWYLWPKQIEKNTIKTYFNIIK